MVPSGSLEVFIEQFVYYRKDKVQIAKVYQTDWSVSSKHVISNGATSFCQTSADLSHLFWQDEEVSSRPPSQFLSIYKSYLGNQEFILEKKCKCNNINNFQLFFFFCCC